MQEKCVRCGEVKQYKPRPPAKPRPEHTGVYTLVVEIDYFGNHISRLYDNRSTEKPLNDIEYIEGPILWKLHRYTNSYYSDGLSTFYYLNLTEEQGKEVRQLIWPVYSPVFWD
jgi:hypothetical protein